MIGRTGWPKEKGRDGERTPMQWKADAKAGFTTGTPWLPVPASVQTYNVENERKEPNSVLNFYRQLLAARKQEPALREGSYTVINDSDPNVYAYLRREKDDVVLVVLNMSATKQTPSFDLSKQGLGSAQAHTILENGATVPAGALKSVSLEPYGVLIAKLSK